MRRSASLPLSVLWISLLAGCAAVVPAQAVAKPKLATPARTEAITPEAIVDLRAVGDVALSPDARRIAYVQRLPRERVDGPTTMVRALFVIDSGGGTPTQYTFEPDSAGSPAWSPDGKTIAFVGRRKGDDGAQVYLVAADGGGARALTRHKTSVRELAWSPDGKRIAFTADREPTEAERNDQSAGRDHKLGDVEGTKRRLWIIDVAGGEAQALSPQDFHVERMRFSPRGDAFALVGGDRADVDGTMMYGGVYRLPLAGGTPQKLCETKGKLGDLAWSPQGRTIAFLGAADIHDPTAGVVWIVPEAGVAGAATPLTLDYQGTGQWLRFVDESRLLVLAHEDTRAAVFLLDTRGGQRKPVFAKPPVCHGADVVRGTFVCAGDTAQHPAEVFAAKLGAPLRRLTHSNPALDRIAMGEQRVVRYKAADGLSLAGVLTLPVGHREGQRHPLVVLPHGGPEGVSLAGWNTRAGYPAQLLASRGFVVFEPNYRGSSGRGVAFGKADHGDLGGKEFDDVLAGIDELVRQGLVDPDRVGMGGWSYGGYFSGLAATKHSKRFRAAMVGAAITNWMSFTGTSEIEHENSLVHWKLWPYDQPELVWSRSPMAHTKGASTPTLIVHGLDDTRVPPEQAKELYRALRHAGVTTELVTYPREGHGLGEREHQLDFLRRMTAWFEQHLAARAG